MRIDQEIERHSRVHEHYVRRVAGLQRELTAATRERDAAYNRLTEALAEKEAQLS